MTFFFDSIHMALASLWGKKIRTFLSVLGIVIGILTVSGLLTLALGVRNQITDSLRGLGENVIIVVPGRIEGGGGFSSGVGVSTLTERDFLAIRDTVPRAKNPAMMTMLTGSVKVGDRDMPGAMILASSPQTAIAFNLEITAGRFFGEQDEQALAHVAVLGSKAAETLFPQRSAVGRIVQVRGQVFSVIGVLKEQPFAASFGGPDMNSAVYLPIHTGWQLSGASVIHRIAMQASSHDQVAALKEDVHRTLLAAHGGEEDITVLTQEDLLKLVGSIFDILTAMLSAIAGISLVVGGIGIMNIMLVAVSERTREIGIRKAVGASRGAILLQFLIESVVMTLFGGLIAVAMYSAGIALAGKYSPIPLAIDPTILTLALVFSACVGIIFGIIPALMASRKNPIEALRYE